MKSEMKMRFMAVRVTGWAIYCSWLVYWFIYAQRGTEQPGDDRTFIGTCMIVGFLIVVHMVRGDLRAE